jgi:hypothetical protein
MQSAFSAENKRPFMRYYALRDPINPSEFRAELLPHGKSEIWTESRRPIPLFDSHFRTKALAPVNPTLAILNLQMAGTRKISNLATKHRKLQPQVRRYLGQSPVWLQGVSIL